MNSTVPATGVVGGDGQRDGLAPQHLTELRETTGEGDSSSTF
jgi:hypothetical protein